MLNGKIIIENCANGNYHSIKGRIKLKKDPKIEHFDIENIIPKDSILKTNDWVLGIVLFLPKESLFSRNYSNFIKKKKNSYFTKMINSFLLVWGFLIFLLILVK